MSIPKVKDVKGCSGCPMAWRFPESNFVAPTLSNGGLIVIGEAPGQEEELQGRPFVGGSGRTFDALAKKAGLKREDMTIANCINCRPPDNVFPTDPDARKYITRAEADQAVSQCLKNHVEPLLKGRKYRRAILLGDKALRFIAGKEGIGTYRGSPLAIPAIDPNVPIAIPTLHPAYLMREQDMIPVVVNDLRKSLKIPPENYNLFPTIEDLQSFKAKEFAFDIETNIPKRGEPYFIQMVGLSDGLGKALVVPFRNPYIKELRRIFEEAKSVVGHNCIQFDLPILREWGVSPPSDADIWDTMLLHHLRFPNLPHDLEFVGSQFSGKPAWKSDKVSFETYCARDTDVTYQVFKELLPLVREEELESLYRYVSVPLGKICKLMEDTGFKIDPSQINKVREDLLTEVQALEQKLPEQLRSYDKVVQRRVPAPEGTLSPKTGKPIKYIHEPATERITPWRSSSKKQEWLYGTTETWQLGLEPVLDVKSGRITTGKLALDKLYKRAKHPGIPALKRLNQIDELLTTFASETMAKRVTRMHPHFNVHGTASGRLSSSGPNLQNVPESARYIYVPSKPGWKIIDVDYSGIENRLTAHLAQDKWRLHNFATNPDFSEHTFLAAKMLGVDYSEIVKDNTPGSPYFNAKKVVHGTNYGLGALKLSKMYDMDFKETKEFIAGWKEIIKDTVRWQQVTVSKAERDGFLTTPFGRKRWLYTSSLFTEALSFIPQSTAADIIFRAMIGMMYERIGWPVESVKQVVRHYEPLPKPAQLLIQVHDALVIECPEEIVDKVVGVIQRVMCQPWPELNNLVVPIGVKVGDSWGSAKKYLS